MQIISISTGSSTDFFWYEKRLSKSKFSNTEWVKKMARVWTPSNSTILDLCLNTFAEVQFDFLRVDSMSFRPRGGVLVHQLTIWNIALKTAYSFGNRASKTLCTKMEENTQENTMSVLKTLHGQTSITIQECYSSMNVISRHILSQNEL